MKQVVKIIFLAAAAVLLAGIMSSEAKTRRFARQREDQGKEIAADKTVLSDGKESGRVSVTLPPVAISYTQTSPIVCNEPEHVLRKRDEISDYEGWELRMCKAIGHQIIPDDFPINAYV